MPEAAFPPHSVGHGFRTATPDSGAVRTRCIRHRGLKRLLEADDAREIRPHLVSRPRRILAALISAPDMDGVAGPPGWRVHLLTGDRAGTCSISVSGKPAGHLQPPVARTQGVRGCDAGSVYVWRTLSRACSSK